MPRSNEGAIYALVLGWEIRRWFLNWWAENSTTIPV